MLKVYLIFFNNDDTAVNRHQIKHWLLLKGTKSETRMTASVFSLLLFFVSFFVCLFFVLFWFFIVFVLLAFVCLVFAFLRIKMFSPTFESAQNERHFYICKICN